MVAAREHSFTSRSPQWPMKLRNKKGLLNILLGKSPGSAGLWLISICIRDYEPDVLDWSLFPSLSPPSLNLRTLNLKICRFSAEDIQLSAFQNSLNSIKSTRRSKCIKVGRTLLHVTSTTHTMKIFPLSSMIQWLYFMSWCIFRNKLLDV